jgi:hypothetical protein
MRRTAALLVAIVFVAGGATALQLPQLPPRDGPPALEQPASGVIRGRVFRADTGERIALALLLAGTPRGRTSASFGIDPDPV